MTYVLLIYQSDPDRRLEREAEEQALAGHRALQKETAERGELRAVAKLFSDRQARTVQRNDGAHVVTDAPYLETKEWLVGFYLVDCDSEEAALKYAKRICPVDGHAIEVRKVEWKWGE